MKVRAPYCLPVRGSAVVWLHCGRPPGMPNGCPLYATASFLLAASGTPYSCIGNCATFTAFLVQARHCACTAACFLAVAALGCVQVQRPSKPFGVP